MTEFNREFVIDTLGQVERNSPGAGAEIIWALYEAFTERGQTEAAEIIKAVVVDWFETGHASPPELN